MGLNHSSLPAANKNNHSIITLSFAGNPNDWLKSNAPLVHRLRQNEPNGAAPSIRFGRTNPPGTKNGRAWNHIFERRRCLVGRALPDLGTGVGRIEAFACLGQEAKSLRSDPMSACSTMPFCSSIAQRTASTTLRTAILPSPVRFS